MPFFDKNLGKRCAIAGRGAKSFVEQDHAADRLLETLGGEQHLTVSPAVVLIGVDLDAIEPSLDRAHALVGGEDTFTFGDHRLSYGFEFLL